MSTDTPTLAERDIAVIEREAAFTRFRAEADACRAAMAVDWPAAEHGRLRLGPIVVSEHAAQIEALCAIFGGHGRGCPAGAYTGLWIANYLWMSDTPDERRDHIEFVLDVLRARRTRILVTGLGLGMVVRGLATVPSVTHIDVVENDLDVVALVGPLVTAYAAERGTQVRVHTGDALAGWRALPAWDDEPTWRADAAWHDIWPTICADHWADMKAIKRAYRGRVSYQACWVESIVRALATGRSR